MDYQGLHLLRRLVATGSVAARTRRPRKSPAELEAARRLQAQKRFLRFVKRRQRENMKAHRLGVRNELKRRNAQLRAAAREERLALRETARETRRQTRLSACRSKAAACVIACGLRHQKCQSRA